MKRRGQEDAVLAWCDVDARIQIQMRLIMGHTAFLPQYCV